MTTINLPKSNAEAPEVLITSEPTAETCPKC